MQLRLLPTTALLLAALAWLSSSLSAQPADDVRVLPSRERTFRIPFQIPPGEQRIREVQLYYSLDQGRAWRPSAVAVPNQGYFNQFTAPQDGLYWFAVRTMDQQGRLYPATEDGLRPGLKVLVDTVTPTAQLRAVPAPQGQVGVEWDVRDENLDLGTLRLEYRPLGTMPWHPLRIEQVAGGQTFWTAMTNATLEVRLTVGDSAGNQGSAQLPLVPGQGGAATGQAGTQNPAPPGSPAIRMVNSKQVSLNYRVEDVGPSGVVVELWYTQDGRNWQKYSEQAKPEPPFVFEVAREGLYGFTLVARSGVGIGDRPPQAGDPPQIWVEVDLTKPDVRLLNADVGRGADAGNLTLAWTAADKNLGRNPITLAYAEHAEGPWQTIAASLENTGRYVWKMPPTGVPYRFLVKVEAADRAGNIGAALTPQPVIVDLSRPKPVIIDVGSAGK